jgi:predicted enzyme related to lactoylglutathione lyase
MGLDLYMLGLMVEDMGRSLDFYRRLGLAIPDDSDGKTHVQVAMENGLVLFLDSNPARFDPDYPGMLGAAGQSHSGQSCASGGYRTLLEFYLKTQAAVEAKYAELTACGYQSIRAPFISPIGVCFAMVADPDGNTILLSGKLDARRVSRNASL